MNDSDPTAPGTPRRIKSFVKREGRLTPGQEKNLAALWPRCSCISGPAGFRRTPPTGTGLLGPSGGSRAVHGSSRHTSMWVRT